MLRCVLFDIDNTLLFKTPSLPEKVFQLASACRPELSLQEVERAYAASELWQGEQIQKENETGQRMDDGEYLENLQRIYRQALQLDQEECERLAGLLTGQYEKAYAPAPGAAALLGRLKERGLLLGIVSNNHDGVRQVLAEQGLAGFFDGMVISEEAGLYKPDPRILELACWQLQVSCQESVYVGDHPFDILCAHSAHMPAVWMPVNRSMSVPAFIGPPEHTIHSLEELPGLL